LGFRGPGVQSAAMGLLPAGRRPSWYDPGRFWSGDDLGLLAGAKLGGEIPVDAPPADRGRRRGQSDGMTGR
jgi:hypothetical protein